MHGILGYLIIGACVFAAVVAVASFIWDMRKSREAEEKRRRLASRLTGK